uniref:Uncharacterized protein n=1 Tax=Cuerna arida TaxID=1464854 RepID=A0A1B6EU65_9HEMI
MSVSVVNTAISAHYGQEAVISGNQIAREQKSTKTIRDTRPENTALLNASLPKEKWNFLNFSHHIEQQFSKQNKIFNKCFNFHFNTSCPTKTIKVCPKKPNNN